MFLMNQNISTHDVPYYFVCTHHGACLIYSHSPSVAFKVANLDQIHKQS